MDKVIPSIEIVLAARGEVAVRRWREVANLCIASNVQTNPVEVADAIVCAEESRGMFEGEEEGKMAALALRLLRAAADLDARGQRPTIENLLNDAREILGT